MEELIIPLLVAVLLILILNARNRTYRKTIEKQDRDLTNLQNEINELKKEPDILKNELNKKSKEINTLKNKLSSANNSIKELKTRISDLCFTREETAKKLIQADQIEEENDRLKKELSKCENERQEAILHGSRKINELQEKCNRLEILISEKAETSRKECEENEKEPIDTRKETVKNLGNRKGKKRIKVVRKINNIKEGQTHNKKRSGGFEYYPDWSDDGNALLGAYRYYDSNDPYDCLKTSYDQYESDEVSDWNEYQFDQDN